MLSFINKAITYGGAMRRYNTCNVFKEMGGTMRRYNTSSSDLRNFRESLMMSAGMRNVFKEMGGTMRRYNTSSSDLKKIRESLMRSDGIRNVFKKIEKITERFEKGDFEEGSEPLSQVVCLRDQLRAVVVKTCADVETLEDRLKKLHELELLEFEEKTKNHYHALLSGAGYYSTASKAPEEVESLLREMVVYGVAPTNITFWVLLKALADSGKLDLALNYLERMEEEFSVKPESTHHGVVIDGFARTKDPQNLAFAVERVKQLVPFQGQEMSFNAILSRCYPPRYPTEEDLEWLVSVIPIAQDLINFLHGASYVYTVLESTHWRLKVRGIIWPKSVLTRPDDVLVGGKIQKKGGRAVREGG